MGYGERPYGTGSYKYGSEEATIFSSISNLFLRIFSHLLPRARAWRITVDKTLKRFFQGLSSVGASIVGYIDLIWLDLLPQSTRQLEYWEQQFGLSTVGLTIQNRNDNLSAAWKITGGQAAKYLQDALRNVGFDVYVHECMTQGMSFSVYRCGDTAAQCGQTGAQCASAQSGLRNPESAIYSGHGYYLANRIFDTEYISPGGRESWPYILYIGGQTFGELASVPANRKEEFETLCLKIKPAHLWLGMLINYT